MMAVISASLSRAKSHRPVSKSVISFLGPLYISGLAGTSKTVVFLVGIKQRYM